MRWLIFTFSISVYLSPFSCVTGDTTEIYQSKVVVEKSKLKAPKWIKRSIGRLYSDQTGFRSVNYQQDVLNLPVAIRDAQTEARDMNRKLVKKEMVANISDQADAGDVRIKSRAKLDQLIDDALTPIHKEDSKIEDIYYEKVLDKSQEPEKSSYRIFVLINFPKVAEKKFMQDLKKKLLRSPQADLKKLSKKLKS